MNGNDATAHVKEHKVSYLINIFGSVIPILMFLVYGMTAMDSLATEAEVDTKIDVHYNGGAHPAAIAELNDVQGQLNDIRSFQIEERIEKQLRLVCEHPELRASLEESIRQLIRDFNKVSTHVYVRPSCIQLGVKS